MQQKVSSLLDKKFTVSVEVFPPRNGHPPKIMLEKLKQIKKLKPDFVSITKGAMGSMRGGTVPIGYMIAEEYGLTPLVHFRSRDHNMREVENLLVDHSYFGIKNILAVMGDPVAGEEKTIPKNRYASDLVKQISDMNKGLYLPMEGKTKRKGAPSDFCIGVASYPEREPKEELKVMRAKVENGADFAITQMFFDVKTYQNHVARMRKAGISIPIVAGIRPVTRPEHVEAAERIFKAKVPSALKRAIRGNPRAAKEACVEFTVKLCGDAAKAGAPGVHLFILNDVELAKDIMGRVREAAR